VPGSTQAQMPDLINTKAIKELPEYV